MYWSDILSNADKYTYEYFLKDGVCRLCWSRNAEHEILSEDSKNTTRTSLSHKIRGCLNIEVNIDEPNKMCSKCFQEIERFYDFKEFCQASDAKLREILQNGILNTCNSDENIKTEYSDTNVNDIDSGDNAGTNESFLIDKKIKRNTKIRKKVSQKHSSTYCSICCLDLENEENLSSHNAESHGIENNGTIFKCFGCEKRFKSRKTRISHEVNFCKGLKDGYKCAICERFLPKRCTYECHMRDHRHNTLTELPEHIFRCGKCPKSFKTKELLTTHTVEHGKDKNFVCDVCGRVFSRQDYLHKHKLAHAGIRRHECPHCAFRATQRSSLIVHIRKHTGERPYSCDLCPQRCISSSNLRAHRRRHLGLKKYECTVCNKKFGYKISLEEHVASTHVHSESHPCGYCGATYTRMRGLRRHLAAKHSKLPANEKNTELIVQISENSEKSEILKDVEYELKDGDSVLLLKHQDGDVYMV